MTDESDDELVRRATAGDPAAREALFAQHRERLRRLVELRLDPRLRGRLDASDVVQDALFEASRRLQEYPAGDTPFYLWLRYLTQQRVTLAHREHLGVQARDARREAVDTPSPSAAALAEWLADSQTSPSMKAARQELCDKLTTALQTLDEMDREVLALRHYEQLGNQEAAHVLGITAGAASHRYARALLKLKEIVGPTLGEQA